MENIVAAGVGQVIRIVPDSSKDIGFSILAAFHYPSVLPVRVYAELSEAESYLLGQSRKRMSPATGGRSEASTTLKRPTVEPAQTVS